GATRGTIAAVFLIEHGLRGLAAAIVAAAIGTGAAYALVTGPMRSDWVFLPLPLVIILGLAVVLTLAIGFAGTWRILGARSAAYLRSE
ncbi:MAG: FtsX-like permease family protein, partial [Alphaproteobacteria bacterium]|nr:FtsX-like permease family protein [Alphaproteobacteria bacterium]